MSKRKLSIKDQVENDSKKLYLHVLNNKKDKISYSQFVEKHFVVGRKTDVGIIIKMWCITMLLFANGIEKIIYLIYQLDSPMCQNI